MGQQQQEVNNSYNSNKISKFQLNANTSLAKTRVKLDDSDSEDNESALKLGISKRQRSDSNSETRIQQQQTAAKKMKKMDKTAEPVEKQVTPSSSLEGYKIIGPDGKPVNLNLVMRDVADQDGKMMKVLQYAGENNDENASRNRKMSQSSNKKMKLQNRNEDRSSDDSENNSMFPEKKHAEQVKEKEQKQNAAAIKFNKKEVFLSQKSLYFSLKKRLNR